MDEAEARSRLCAALDVATAREAADLAKKLDGRVGTLKVGLELFVAEGHVAVDQVRSAAPGSKIFLDLKLCDIPETVARAVKSAAKTKADLLTVHASGGPEMLKRAVEAAAGASDGTLSVLAVTVLTSLDAPDLEAMAWSSGAPAAERVRSHALRLAEVAWKSGVRGFVCSPREASAFRDALGPEAYLVTPGVRPAGTAGSDDQKRVETPVDAIRAGASLLVVGRPFRDALDPGAAADAMVRELVGS
jgi:orotidine-5'-phosphate decarboxylase